MTVHPIDTEALRAELEAAVVDYRSPNLDLAARVLSALTVAEHRATRAEAQSAIRGRAVVMYRERAREAEARIKAVERLALAADDGTEYEHNGHDPAEGEAECPGCWALGIRRALDGDA